MTTQTETRCVCSNCDWTGPEDEAVSLYECADLLERIAPGEPVPAGECPECGALVHIDDAEARMRDAAGDMLAALRAYLDREDIADDELGVMIRAAIAKAERGAR